MLPAFHHIFIWVAGQIYHLIEKGIFSELQIAENKIKQLYTVQSQYLDVSCGGNEKELRNIVTIKDCSTFIEELIKERNLNINRTLIRVSIDGGQGFLKFCVNVFDPEMPEEVGEGRNYLGSGVQRIQILAMVEDVIESYENMKSILGLLKLERLEYKLGNMYTTYISIFGY